jgi:hypothetical protein
MAGHASSMINRIGHSVRGMVSPEYGIRDHMGQNPPDDQHRPA